MSCALVYPDTRPCLGDKEAVLYRKWVQILSNQQGGALAPNCNDAVYDSIRKILTLYNAINENSCS